MSDNGYYVKLLRANRPLSLPSGNLRNQFQLEQSLEVSGGMSPMDRQKLDIMYNKSQFERLIVHDEHRVLIDWIKNRFRSLCILSDDPCPKMEIPARSRTSVRRDIRTALHATPE